MRLHRAADPLLILRSCLIRPIVGLCGIVTTSLTPRLGSSGLVFLHKEKRNGERTEDRRTDGTWHMADGLTRLQGGSRCGCCGNEVGLRDPDAAGLLTWTEEGQRLVLVLGKIYEAFAPLPGDLRLETAWAAGWFAGHGISLGELTGDAGCVQF